MNQQTLPCREHSGVCVNIANLKQETIDLWEKVNENRRTISTMKNWLIATLTSSVLSLIGVLIILLIQLAKATGKSP
jgi:hypothetical protein